MLTGRRGKSLLKSLGPATEPKIEKKEKNMKEQDRVLIRRGARELTPEEVERISGGLRTLTLCSIGSAGQRDGDIGEC